MTQAFEQLTSRDLEILRHVATFRRTTYAVGQTQQQIRAQGLPEALAVRLALGI